MSDIQYGKIRLEVPDALDGQTATLTTPKGQTRSVVMQSPKIDIYTVGLEQYRIQAGISDKSVSLDYGEMKKIDVVSRIMVKKLPYDFYNGVAVITNGDEIHILGGSDSKRLHYIFKDSVWTSVSTLPYDFYQGSAVVLNNEIHILSGLYGSTSHYKWNGVDWVSVSTLPDRIAKAVVLNNEIHILGGGSGSANFRNHYKWNGISWTSVSTLPYDLTQSIGAAVVFNNEIHIISGDSSNLTKHYKWNGTRWVSVSTLPYDFYGGGAIAVNIEGDNAIYIFGGGNGSTAIVNNKKVYRFSNNRWLQWSNIPCEFSMGSVVYTNNNDIFILGSVRSDYRRFAAHGISCTGWIIGTD